MEFQNDNDSGMIIIAEMLFTYIYRFCTIRVQNHSFVIPINQGLLYLLLSIIVLHRFRLEESNNPANLLLISMPTHTLLITVIQHSPSRLAVDVVKAKLAL